MFAASAASFYAEQADLLADALAPLAEAFVAFTGRPARPEALAAFVAAHYQGAAVSAASASVAGNLDAWLAVRSAEVPAVALRFLGAIGSNHA